MKIIAIVSSIIIMIILLSINDTERGKYYDCSISEFHPDYPVEVKELCRKLRSDEHKKLNNYI